MTQPSEGVHTPSELVGMPREHAELWAGIVGWWLEFPQDPPPQGWFMGLDHANWVDVWCDEAGIVVRVEPRP